MTTPEKNKIKTYREAIRLIKRGFGGGHTRKHSFDFDISCLDCQSLIVVSFLENAIDLAEWHKTKKNNN